MTLKGTIRALVKLGLKNPKDETVEAVLGNKDCLYNLSVLRDFCVKITNERAMNCAAITSEQLRENWVKDQLREEMMVWS